MMAGVLASGNDANRLAMLSVANGLKSRRASFFAIQFRYVSCNVVPELKRPDI
jgi:hypothetical protein